jgi:hypothetical protein
MGGWMAIPPAVVSATVTALCAATAASPAASPTHIHGCSGRAATLTELVAAPAHVTALPHLQL